MFRIYHTFFSFIFIKVALSSQELKLIFVGDISFSDINFYLKEYGNCSYEKSFKEIRSRLKADFKIGNLETPFGNLNNTPEERNDDKAITLLSNPTSVEALKYLGLDVLVVANNHFADYGESAMRETVATLWKEGMYVSGVTFGREKYSDQEPIILEKNGLKIGILSYCAIEDGCLEAVRGKRFLWPALYDEKSCLKDIKKLRKVVDFVIIYLHWGSEYSAVANDLEIYIASSINHYVDVIIGSHTHIPSEHFYINNTLVVHSLGNFLFPMKHTRHTVFKERGTKEKVKGMKEMVSKYENPSTIAEVVKLSFNRSGLIKEKSLFAHFKITMDENNCFVIETQATDSKWKTICSKQDKKCAGTTRCNPVNCVEEMPNDGKNQTKKTRGKKHMDKL